MAACGIRNVTPAIHPTNENPRPQTAQTGDNLACDEDLLAQAWQIDGQAEAPDTNAIGDLARRKYGNPEWIYRRP